MANGPTIVAFDVVERREVDKPEIDRLAYTAWRKLSARRERACDRPRWINSGPVAEGSDYIAHRYEGTVDD